MAESINQRVSKMSDHLTKSELKALLDTVLVEFGVLRTSITGITAKLDADVGVTDANYAALHDPPANTLLP